MGRATNTAADQSETGEPVTVVSIVVGIGIGLTVAFIVAMLADIFGDRIPGWPYVAMEGCLASGGVAVSKVYEDENGTKWDSYSCEEKEED